MNDVNIITSDFCFVHDTEPPGGVQLPRIEEDICIDTVHWLVQHKVLSTPLTKIFVHLHRGHHDRARFPLVGKKPHV